MRTGTIRIQHQRKLVAKFEMGKRACAILVLGEVPMLGGVICPQSKRVQIMLRNSDYYQSCLQGGWDPLSAPMK